MALGSTYLLARLADGRTLKAACVAKRLYQVVGAGPAAEGVIETFQAWPTNVFCQGQSNSGVVPGPGTCY